MEIRNVTVIGLGTMGAGIAEVLARGGLTVTAVEADPRALSHGMAAVSDSLARAVTRGRLSEAERAEILGRVRPAPGIAHAAGADLVIEVVPEEMDVKRQVFAELDRVCHPETILATNTSSLSVTSIAAGTRHPGRVAGVHFFNPAPVMRLVEVVTTVLTSEGTAEAVSGFVRRLGKTPVSVSDRAGFVANALLLPYLNHAVRLAETGYATRDDIDVAMSEGVGLPMGPLSLLDLIGLDTSLSVLQVLEAEFGGTRYTPAPRLRRLVDAGMTGRKSGRGFYDYSGEEGPPKAFPLPPPSSVALIGGGDETGESLAAMIEKAGITLVRVPPGQAVPDDASRSLTVVGAGPAGGVLGLALSAGAPGAVGLHLAGGSVLEVVTTATSARAGGEATALARALGLIPVRCQDRPGLLAAALLYPHIGDAIRMVEEGYASVGDIDTAMTLGCGYPRGPFHLADEIGAERLRSVLALMHERSGDPAFAPPALLADHAAAGLPFRAAG